MAFNCILTVCNREDSRVSDIKGDKNMHLGLIFAVIVTSQNTPTPLDAHLANRASVSMSVEFTYSSYFTISPLHDGSIDPLAPNVIFATAPDFEGKGKWSTDGQVEHTIFRDSYFSDASKPRRTDKPRYIAAAEGELIADAELQVYNRLEHPSSPFQVSTNDPSTTPPLPLVTPFNWFKSSLTNGVIKAEFRDVLPTVKKSERYGIIGELEVYRKPLESGWYQAEVFYDPSKGYMPRYVRLIAAPTADMASIKEVIIQEATPSQEGGFVPVEWCDTYFTIEGFNDKYPHYTADNVITPVGKIRIGHFKATRISPAVLPICLEPRTQPRRISTPQKSVSTQDIQGPLTIKALRTALGRNPLTPALIPFDVIKEESDQYPAIPPTRGDRTAVVTGISLALTGVVLTLWFRRWTRRNIVPIIALASCLTGCQRNLPTQESEIGVEFEQPVLLFKPGQHQGTINLRISNNSSQDIDIFQISGGCSCRRVNTALLPMHVRTSSSSIIPMTIDDRSRYDVQKIHFTIDTNRGSFHPHASIQAIAIDSTTPTSLVIHHKLKESSDSVEFVHRHLFPSGESWVPTLKAPSNFRITQLDAQAGTVTGTSGYDFLDTRYLVELTDSAVGTFNDQITISSAEGRQVATIPVTWQRRPNLSTSPDRILLGSKSVRVFLASDDETIEFKEICSVPEGIRAVITSPREMTVSLASTTDKLINSHLEVRTTSDSDPLVRVPVVRYVSNLETARPSSD